MKKRHEKTLRLDPNDQSAPSESSERGWPLTRQDKAKTSNAPATKPGTFLADPITIEIKALMAASNCDCED